MRACLVNGVESRSVAVADRGLQYGDGLFETLRLVGGRPRLLADHLARLARGCARLGIPVPPPALLEEEISRVAAVCDPDGIVKVIVTRGEGGRGYRPPTTASPTRIVSGHEPPAHDPRSSSAGIVLRLCTTRLGRNPVLAGLKHLNRLEHVLARAEWDDPAVPEGLMLDDRGFAVCGTQSNVFAVLGDRLVTPPVDQCGVAGVMRGFVLRIAATAGIAVDVRPVPMNSLHDAREVFVTSAVVGIWPVREFDGRSRVAGPVAHRLQAGLAEAAP